MTPGRDSQISESSFLRPYRTSICLRTGFKMHGICKSVICSSSMGTLIAYLSFSLCFSFLLILVRFLNKAWWTPIRLQSIMRSQGIKGPSYRIFHGNIKEMMRMRKEIMSIPMELSHHQAFTRIHPYFYSWIKTYGTNFLHWHGTQAQLVITDLELIKETLINKDGEYYKVEYDEYMKKLIGDSIVTTRGEKWVKVRKLANHAFHAECLKGMIPAMITSVEMMLEKWKQHEGKEIEVFKEFKVLTSEVISRTAFGSSYLEGERIFNMMIRMVHLIARNSFRVRIPGIRKLVKSSDDKESDKLKQGIQDCIMKIIKKREEAATTGQSESYGSDFLGLLLKAYHENDRTKKISIDDLMDECKTFYVGGQETTACALTWTVLLLALHPDWQEKAREEVIELFGNQNPTPDGIARLKTVSMIVNESLRLYPPIPKLQRKVEKTVRLGKLTLPRTVEIYIPILALHYNPQIWGEDVHLFKPERFAEGVAKATNDNLTAFLPFGMGPRTCVGVNFAVTETKIALSMILQRYRFSLSPSYVHSPIYLVTICPQEGVPVKLQAL